MFDVGRSAGALDPGRSGGRVGASVGATGASAEASAAGSTPDHLGGADDSAARHCAALVAYLAELRGAPLSSCNVCASAHPTRRSCLGRSALGPQWPRPERPVGGPCLGVWGDIGPACPPAKCGAAPRRGRRARRKKRRAQPLAAWRLSGRHGRAPPVGTARLSGGSGEAVSVGTARLCGRGGAAVGFGGGAVGRRRRVRGPREHSQRGRSGVAVEIAPPRPPQLVGSDAQPSAPRRRGRPWRSVWEEGRRRAGLASAGGAHAWSYTAATQN